jgi:hypothetical protein
MTGPAVFAPFVPFNAGKRGIKRINSYTFAGSGTGTAWLGLVKPLAYMPLTQLCMGTERDFVFMCPTLPRIYDGACLGLLVAPGGATIVGSTIFGSFTFVEG